MNGKAGDQAGPEKWPRPVRLLAGVVSLGPFARHVPTLARVALSVAIITSIGLLLVSGAPPGPRLVMQAPYNPPVNIAPNPDFLVSGNCTGSTGAYTCANPCISADLTFPTFSSNPACTAYALAAINNARAQENVATLGRLHAHVDLDIAEVVSAPMAAGLATLVEDERDMGATLIDMGGGTTESRCSRRATCYTPHNCRSAACISPAIWRANSSPRWRMRNG